MSPDGSLTTLHAFTGEEDGASPYAGLTEGTAGRRTLTLDFTIESKVPATWNALAVTPFGIANLWSQEIPAVGPATSVNVPIPGVPPVGTIGMLTSLSTPALGAVCFDWKTVNPNSASLRLP